MAKRPAKVDYSKGPLIQPPKPRQGGRSTDADLQVTGPAAWIIKEILAYEKIAKTFESRGEKIVKRYKDERDEAFSDQRKFNILWSNVQVLKPTLYARTPKAEIVRRFKDRDNVARIACEIAERAADIEIERTGLTNTFEQALMDRLLPGRGTIWVSYDPQMQGDNEVIVKQGDKLLPEYVSYKDFGHSVVPIWEQVRLVWRWKYFTKDEFKDRFGKQYLDKISFTDKNDQSTKEQPIPQARIAEVWDKHSKKVYWVYKGCGEYLDEYEDPLKLENFFPCPRPLYATLTNDSLIPTADFYIYQDQANEVDKLTGRINRLTDALKVVGVYDQDNKSLEDLFDPRGTADNTLVPVNINDLTGKGGITNSIQLVPLDLVVKTLTAAYAARAQAIQAIYEITGLSDILRGATDPNETAAAQNIKAQFGGTRIRALQQDVANFTRDVIRIMTELIVEMYDPMTLWEMTSAQTFTDPQTFAQAVMLLRNEKSRGFRIDIETDSTIALDEQEGKQAATEFITAVSGYMQQAFPLVQTVPQATKMVGETLLFLVREYKAGRQLEGTIESFVSDMEQAAIQKAQNPQQTPDQIKAQADMQVAQQKAQAQAQIEQQKLAANAQLEQQKLTAEQQKAAAELRLKQQIAEAELALEAQKAQMQIDLEKYKADVKAKADLEVSLRKVQAENERSYAEMQRTHEREEKMGEHSREMNSAMGEGLKAIGAGLQAIGKPKAIRVENDAKGKRYVSE